jgi:hypothetical protein
MKKKALFVYLIAFVAGTVSSVFVASPFLTKTMESFQINTWSFGFIDRINNEMHLEGIIENTDMALSGDFESIISQNCTLIEFHIRMIENPAYEYDGQLEERMMKSVEKATEYLNGLKSNGHC